MARNLSINQRVAFGRKSLEHDATLTMSESPLGELTVSKWKQCKERMER